MTGQVSVDIPFRITINTQTSEIQTKRMKKDYRIVYINAIYCIYSSSTSVPGIMFLSTR